MPTIPSAELADKAVDTIRFLAADAVQKANSGHPGMPMGAADMAFVLWSRHLRFNPAEPRWIDRDRFILSAGHGSTLLYSLLHLAGFDVTMEDLQSFRQKGSRTPGHPEFGHTVGVEVTSGPLGQGFANGVGFALSQAMLSAQLGPGNPVEDHWVFGIVSDGDIMEGVAAEAASFAGHHRLGRIVYLWDDNEITIDGRTSITFSGEDVRKRFEGYGWHAQSVDGRDHDGISRAIDAAKGDPRPSLIQVRTVIGYGAPNKQGKSSVHGAPLGEEELGLAKDHLHWPREPRFLVPDDVRTLWREVVQGKQGEYRAWKVREEAWRATHPEKARLLDAHLSRQVPADAAARLLAGADATDATRKLSQAALQKVAGMVPALAGGSADLAESNLTEIKGGGSVAADHLAGRNIHFGIREHAMGAIANGMAYDGAFIPFVSTFLIFSDYMRPPIRLAALSRLQVICVFTHDTIFLGEDGPTHQPVEQLTALRAIPDLHVVRPADGLEVALAWAHALERRDGPTALVLTRQKPGPVQRSVPFDAARAARGGYVVADPPGAKATLVATGSEVALAQAAAALLAEKGTPVRVVSMPCRECFLAQPEAYRREVLPRGQRVAVVEAARGLEWWQLAGTDGLVLGIDRFGASAPEKVLAETYGFTPAQVAQRVGTWLAAP